jgi:DNA-binding response OmpR family regulator/chromosome segregation ATPase
MSASTQPAPTAPAQPKTPDPETNLRKRILLVEGDGFTRLVLLFRLRLAGFRVDFTSNGIIAKEKLTSRHPDALLVELKLRGLSGLELIKAARSDPEFGDRPIYVFTNADDMNRSARKEISRLATKLFDKKTVTREDLVRALASALLKKPIFGNGDATTPAGAEAHDSSHGEKVEPGELQEIIAGVRSQVKDLAKCTDGKSRAASRGELLGRVHSLTSCADAAGLTNLSRQSKALEELLTQLGKENKDRTDAALGTVSRAIDVLNSLPAEPAEKKEELNKFTAIIVDEAASSNKAIKEALTQAGFAPVSFEDPTRVRDYLSSNHADLVVANVLLPEAHGLSLDDIRHIPMHNKTPVVFVPESQFLEHSWEDLPTSAPRVDSNPLLLKELTVKALNAVQSKDTTSAASPAPAPKKAAKPVTPVNPALGDGFDIFKGPKAASSAVNAPTPAAQKPAKPLTPVNPALDNSFELFKGPKPTDESRLVQPANPASFLPPPPTSHTLPAMVPDGPGLPVPRPDSYPQNGTGKATILLVEDDPFVLRVYRRVLKREGFEVEVAEDGLAAVDLLPKVKPGLVVLDLMLPKMHGLEVLKFIRADATLKDTPVLVLSNAYLEALEVKANQAGANMGLRKTECTPTLLIHHISELLGLPDEPLSEPEPNLGEEALAATDEDEEFAETAIFTRQAGLRQDAPKEVVKIRQLSLGYIKAGSDEERLAQLTELYRRVRFLTARAGLSGLTKIAELCSALEGLLFQIVFNQIQATTSTYQTIAQAVDCLDRLSQNRDTTFVEPRATSRVLVVDDDSVCNFTMVTTLKRAGFDVVGTQDPADSLRLLSEQGFNLVLLDVNMPGMNGFEVCEQLRQMPQYKYTPVVFVTIDAEFQNRARSVMAGGNDLMGKPVCPSELIVKVTMHLLNASSQGAVDSVQQPLEMMQEAEAAPEGVLEAGELETDAVEAVEEQAAVENLASDTDAPAEPGAAEPDFQTESLSGSLETSTDGWQTEEQSLETLQPAALQPDVPETPQAEPGFEEQTVEAEEFAAVESHSSETVPANRIDQEAEPIPAPEELVFSAPNTDEATESQVQEHPGELVHAGQDLQEAQEEHEALTNRISKTEMELSHAKASIENRDKAIEALRNRLEQLAGGKPTREALATKPGEEPTKVSPAEADQLANSTAIVAEAQARCDQLERELTQLRQAREELTGKVAREQQSASQTNRLAQELEQRLAQNAADLERAKADADWQKQEKERAEAELRRKLEAAQTASAQSEAAQKESQARCKELEQELAELQQTREDLNSNFAKEQQAASESRTRIKQLESDLESKAAQLERAKAELETHGKDRSRIESELVRQLELATTSSTESEAAQKQAQTRCKELEQELAELQQTREDLNSNFVKEQHGASESRARIKKLEGDLESKSAQLERAKAELETHGKDRSRVESELVRQLELVTASGTQSEAEQKQAQARCHQLEQELAELRTAREEAKGQFAKEQQVTTESRARINELESQLGAKSAELERAKGDWEKQSKERGGVESDLRRQLEAAAEAGKQTETAHKQAEDRCHQLEKQLAELRNAREEARGQVAKEQQVNTEFCTRIKELENQFGAITTELERSKADWENQAKERGRVESELRRQLSEAAETSKQTDAAHKQAQDRCRQLEKELADLRQAREELGGKFSQEQQATAESRNQIKELEGQLDSKSAELARAKADWENQSKQRASLESDLRQQLEAATATRKQTDTAHKHAQERCRQLEQDLAQLRQAREELDGKFNKAQKAGAESDNRLKELEGHLSKRSAELERAKADFEKQAQEHSRLHSDLQGQLQSAGTQAKQTDSAHKQSQARCSQLEQELAELRKTREQLNGKLAQEQEATQNSSKRIKELEAWLQEKAGDLKRARAEQENHAKERARMEAELRRQLELANASGKQSENAQKQAQTRSAQFERELNDLRQAHEKLDVKLAKEHEGGQKSAKRLEELQAQLDKKAAELKRAKVESEDHAEEHSRLEAELRRQLEAASAAGKQHEAAHKKSQNWCGQLEQEMAALRQAREELTGKFTKEQQVSTESRTRIKEMEGQLESKTAELQRAKADLENHLREQVRLETELRRQLDAATTSGKQHETAHNQSRNRCGQLEQELAGLVQLRESLQGKFAQEQQLTAESRARIKELEGQLGSKSTELQRANAEAEKQVKERTQVEAELRRQLEAAAATGKQNETALKQAHNKLEQELASLRQSREELNGKFVKEQQAATESRTRIKELESQLGSKAAEIQRAKADQEAQTKERGQVEAELRRQLEAVTALGKQNETSLQQAQARLEQELAALRQSRDELNSKFTSEQQVSTESRARIKELEGRVDSKASELERSKADIENHVKERARVESELRQQLETAATASAQNETALKQAQSKLEQDLAGLQKAREEVNGRLAKEQQAAAESRARINDLEKRLQSTEASRGAQVSELEQRVAQGVAALSRATADLSREQGERQRSEERAATLNTELQQLHVKFSNLLQTQQTNLERISALEEKLVQGGHALARRTADFEHSQAENRLALEQLENAKGLNLQLRKNLSHFEAANKTFDKTRQDLQSRLDASLTAAKETGTKLQSETAERQRMSETLAAVQHALQEQSQRGQRLQAELQATLEARRQSEAKLRKETEEHHTLSNTHAAVERELREQSQKRQVFETELETARKVLREVEGKLQTEATERQRLAAALDGVQRDLQTQTRKSETLETELRGSLESVRGAEARLQKEAAERQHFAETLDKVQHELQAQTRKCEALELEHRTTVGRLREHEAGLEKEITERYRLTEALESTRLNLRDRTQRSELELSKLQSALQFEQLERKRQEIQNARMRHFALEAARAARVQRNNLRRQIRESVDSLCQSTRKLLALPLSEQHKKLAEAVLQDGLAVQSRLREADMSPRMSPPVSEAAEIKPS